jgi:3-oxoacyl-(acyl-carrier-protein) synthase III
MIPARISGSSSVVPGPAVHTAEMSARLNPQRDPAEVEARTGIAARHFAPAGTTAAALGARALQAALEVAQLPPSALARIVFVDSLGGDMLIPATSNGVAAALGLAGSCDCFDLNNACMGFLSALDVAARSVATGHGPIGIVVVELPSRYLTPEEPRPFVVLGDGVAAVVVDEAREDEGILGSFLRNDVTLDVGVRFGHGTLSGRGETIRFGVSNAELSRMAVAAVVKSARAVLTQADVELDDVEWVLPHQPNGAMLREIVRVLELRPERVVPVVNEVGSVGAASIPISLDRLLRSGRVQPRDRILMIGVGAGLSSGAILFRVGS